ncbi:MAG: hypothetical protein NVS2B14_00060 [Chamaesiphon sp.]
MRQNLKGNKGIEVKHERWKELKVIAIQEEIQLRELIDKVLELGLKAWDEQKKSA